MKKLIHIFLCLALLLTLAACGGNNPTSFDDRTELELLQATMDSHDNVYTLHKSEWDESRGSWENAAVVVEDLVNEDPHRWYVDFSGTTMKWLGGKDKTALEVHLAYHFSEKELEAKQAEIEAAAQTLLDKVPANADDYTTALVLHDELIRHVTYGESTHDQSVYGALVEGQAVCNGFAMAYEYLLEKAGIACDTVIGYGDWQSVMFADYGSIRHAWNIVTLTAPDGAVNSYYVDTTWDNTDTRDAAGNEYVLHNWFCLSKALLDSTGRGGIEEIYDYSQWDMTSDALNFYEVNHAVFADMNEFVLADTLKNQKAAGWNVLTVRWTNDGDYLGDMIQLEEFGGMQKLLSALEEPSLKYSFTDFIRQDGNFVLNIFLNPAA